MEDKNKMDQQSGRPNRDQETEKKPSQGSQEINRPGQGNVQQGQQGNRANATNRNAKRNLPSRYVIWRNERRQGLGNHHPPGERGW